MSCLYLYCGLLTRGSGLFVVQELANLVFISIPWPPSSWVGYVCCSGTRQSCVYIHTMASLLVGRVCLLFRNSPILCLYTYHGLLNRGSGMFVVQELANLVFISIPWPPYSWVGMFVVQELANLVFISIP